MHFQRQKQRAKHFLHDSSFTLFRRIAIPVWGLILVGCASLPDNELVIPHDQTVEFENAHGPVSTRKGDAILQALKGKSGDIDILQKHLALEQAINADDPLVLANKLVLLQDGPATYKAMFTAMRAARDHINLETYIFEDDEVGRQFADVLAGYVRYRTDCTGPLSLF